MTFKELAEVLHPVLGHGEGLKWFISALISILMGDPEDDSTVPYQKDSDNSSLEKIASGERPLAKKNAEIIFNGFQANREHFIDCLIAASQQFSNREDEDNNSPFEEMINQFNLYGVIINDETNVFESIADAVTMILWAHKNGIQEGYDFSFFPSRTISGQKLPGVPLRHVILHNGKISVCGKDLTLSSKLTPPDELDIPKERPYVEALLAAYQTATEDSIPKSADALFQSGDIGKLFSLHLRKQRENFYEAESISRFAREVFRNGEELFEDLKTSLNEGIEHTYYFEKFDNAYDRVNGVLEKSTTLSLENNDLNQIKNGITPKAKMGLCHELVNDGTITSWEV